MRLPLVFLLACAGAFAAPLPHECAALLEAAGRLEAHRGVRAFHDLRTLEHSDVARHFSPEEWRSLSWKIAENGLARTRVFYVAEGTAVTALIEDARRLAPSAWARDHAAEAALTARLRRRGLVAWLTNPWMRVAPLAPATVSPAMLAAYTLRPFLAEEVDNPTTAIVETRSWATRDGHRQFAFVMRAAWRETALIVSHWTEVHD